MHDNNSAAFRCYQHTADRAFAADRAAGLRVSGRRRNAGMGTRQAWVFDDTIEHEAWNRSDAPRAILIFDIWNPLLTAAERDVVRAATELVGTYYAGTPEGAA